MVCVLWSFFPQPHIGSVYRMHAVSGLQAASLSLSSLIPYSSGTLVSGSPFCPLSSPHKSLLWTETIKLAPDLTLTGQRRFQTEGCPSFQPPLSGHGEAEPMASICSVKDGIKSRFEVSQHSFPYYGCYGALKRSGCSSPGWAEIQSLLMA